MPKEEGRDGQSKSVLAYLAIAEEKGGFCQRIAVCVLEQE